VIHLPGSPGRTGGNLVTILGCVREPACMWSMDNIGCLLISTSLMNSHEDVDTCSPATFAHRQTPCSQENVIQLDYGLVLITKCRWHTNNDRSPTKGEGCQTSGTLLVPLCANTECRHRPSTLGHNAEPARRGLRARFPRETEVRRA
jgi:hypothetical protein